MRIALVTNLYPPIQTGSSFWTRELARYLAASGDEVVVITSGDAGKTVSKEENGFTVYRLPRVLRLPKWNLFLRFDQFHLFHSRRNLEALVSILRNHRVEMVHQCGQLLDSIYLTRAACRKLALPSLCTLHTKIYHPESRIYDALFRAADAWWIRRYAMSGFEAVVGLDKPIADYARRVYRPRRLEVVPVCIDDGILDSIQAASPEAAPVRILSVGHVTEMRNRLELLSAVAALRSEGIDLRLMIIGKVLTEAARDYIRGACLSEAVEMPGELPREKVFSYMSASQIHGQWIDYPGLGSSTLEAMAAGLPVLAYGTEDIFGDVPFRHLENIVFVDPYRPETVKCALRRLASDPQLRAAIGRRARALVRDHLTWSVTVHKFRALYRDLIGRRG